MEGWDGSEHPTEHGHGLSLPEGAVFPEKQHFAGCRRYRSVSTPSTCGNVESFAGCIHMGMFMLRASTFTNDFLAQLGEISKKSQAPE